MKNVSCLFVVLAGIASGVGILVPLLWFLSPLGLGFFFFLVYETKNTKESLWAGALFGTITAGAGLLSLLEIIPPVSGESFLPTLASALFLWSVPSIALGVTSVPIAYLLYVTRENILAPVIAILLWLINEVLRMWAWTFVSYGNGAVFEPHLSIAGLAYALADNEITLQLAQFGGFFGLTVAVGIFAVTISSLLSSLRYRNTYLKTGVLCLACMGVTLVPFVMPERQGTSRPEELTIAIVNSDTLFNSPLSMPDELGKFVPDIVLFPEDKMLSQFPEEVRNQYEKWRTENKNLITVRSGAEEDKQGRRHVAVWYELSSGEVIASQEKRFLMPQGEYIPYLYSLVFTHVPYVSIPHIKDEESVAYGTSLTSTSVKGTKVGTLLCSEVFSPFLYRTLVEREGATILFNLGDPMWFRGSNFLFRKTVQVAKVHAVQNNAYVLFAQNSAPSFVISPRGSVITQTEPRTQGILLVTTPKS